MRRPHLFLKKCLNLIGLTASIFLMLTDDLFLDPDNRFSVLVSIAEYSFLFLNLWFLSKWV
jgi:hypothetical protein